MKKLTMEILSSSIIAPCSGLINMEIGEIWTDVFDAPLSVYVKGENIKAVTYSIDNVAFFLNE